MWNEEKNFRINFNAHINERIYECYFQYCENRTIVSLKKVTPNTIYAFTVEILNEIQYLSVCFMKHHFLNNKISTLRIASYS